MSTNVVPRNGGQVLWGPMSVFAAPAGTREPVIDVPVTNCGNQTLASGTAANAAGIDAAVAAADVETGFGKGAKLSLTFAQPTANAVWTAWIAVSEELTEDGGWTKRGTTADGSYTRYPGGPTITESLVVYSKTMLATDTSVTVNIELGGTTVWTALGYHESCSVSEAGVTIAFDQSVDFIRCAGAPGAVKAIRSSVDLKVSFELNDMTSEVMAQLLDNAAIIHSANTGTVGWRSVRIHRGVEMQQYAVVARGPGLSSYVQGGNVQLWIPYSVQTGSPAPVFARSGAAALAVEFTALEDQTSGVDLRYGRFTQQDRIRA